MAVDHILFNKLKWFNVADNADSINANGRSFYALPSKIKLTKDSSNVWVVMGVGMPGSNFASGSVFDVIGFYPNTYNEGGKKRYLVNFSDFSGNFYILSVPESDCTPIWG